MKKELLPEERLHSHFFSLMARLLATPADRTLLDLLHRIPTDRSADGEMAAAWIALRKAAMPADPADEAAEYHRLFYGIDGQALLPYASWYRTGRLAEKPLAEIRQDLNRLGFERAEGSAEPEDHAAALCETMAMLYAGHSASERSAFFNRHMADWIGRFLTDLAEASRTEFYRAIGNIGLAFFRFEAPDRIEPEASNAQGVSLKRKTRRSNENDQTAEI